MLFQRDDKSCDRERRRIVIAVRNRRVSMVNCSDAILLTQSSTTKASVEAPTQKRMRSTVIGLKFQGVPQAAESPSRRPSASW